MDSVAPTKTSQASNPLNIAFSYGEGCIVVVAAVSAGTIRRWTALDLPGMVDA